MGTGGTLGAHPQGPHPPLEDVLLPPEELPLDEPLLEDAPLLPPDDPPLDDDDAPLLPPDDPPLDDDDAPLLPPDDPPLDDVPPELDPLELPEEEPPSFSGEVPVTAPPHPPAARSAATCTSLDEIRMGMGPLQLACTARFRAGRAEIARSRAGSRVCHLGPSGPTPCRADHGQEKVPSPDPTQLARTRSR